VTDEPDPAGWADGAGSVAGMSSNGFRSAS